LFGLPRASVFVLPARTEKISSLSLSIGSILKISPKKFVLGGQGRLNLKLDSLECVLKLDSLECVLKLDSLECVV
jgi:hypothetical protein